MSLFLLNSLPEICFLTDYSIFVTSSFTPKDILLFRGHQENEKRERSDVKML